MPGQDTLLTIRNTLLAGRRAGCFTALGVSTGLAVWALAASAGLAALIKASEPAFLAIKLAGAAYLVYLGLHALHNALRAGPEPPADQQKAGAARAPAAAFRQGLISNPGNPKIAVFFTSLLPQFTSAGSGSFLALLLLGLVFCLLTLTWLAGYAFAVAKASDVMRRSRIRRALDGLAGTVLIAFGVRLATEQR